MSVPVLLDLLSELRKRDKMRGLPSIYLFRNYFNKINDTVHKIAFLAWKRHYFAIFCATL